MFCSIYNHTRIRNSEVTGCPTASANNVTNAANGLQLFVGDITVEFAVKYSAPDVALKLFLER